MRAALRIFSVSVVALIGLSLGYKSALFDQKKAATVMSQPEAERLRQKAQFYFLMRNYQGALDLTQNISKENPEYDKIQIIRRMAQYKISKSKSKESAKKSVITQAWDYEHYPSAVRDSLFDSLYASSEGRCFDAFKDMQTVSKYTNVNYDQWIYDNCKETREKRVPASVQALENLKLTGNKSY
ncbi:MAG TPA: hypothetical protein VF412_19655 [Bdellovibrio sp.]|uniref:hypothetical protein n=1 Tax=Bdellovibrio sp. TaxID=28201 RepID=UPI002F0DFAD0